MPGGPTEYLRMRLEDEGNGATLQGCAVVVGASLVGPVASIANAGSRPPQARQDMYGGRTEDQTQLWHSREQISSHVSLHPLLF